MSKAVHTVLSLTAARLAFAVLAFLAVATVLAQPFCDLHEDEALHQEDCCASLADGTVAVPATAVVTGFKARAVLPPAAAWPAGWRTAQGPEPAIPPDRPPISRPYHARSARILI